MRKLTPILALIVLAALVPVIGLAIDTDDTDPWAFTSQEAIDAKAAYDQSIHSARTDYDAAVAVAREASEDATAETLTAEELAAARDVQAEAIAAARTAYQAAKLAARERLVVDLTAALAVAREANDLDEALRIRAAAAMTEAGWPVPIEAEAAWSYEGRWAEAIENVLASTAQANAQRAEALAEAESTLTGSLLGVITDATQAGDLDDARRMRDARPHVEAFAAESAHGLVEVDGRMELPLIQCDFATNTRLLRFDVIDAGQLHVMAECKGRESVFMTHPKNEDSPCLLAGNFWLPPERAIRLAFAVVNNESNDWRLVVKVNGRILEDAIIGPAETGNDWADFEIDLTDYAGTRIRLELIHFANNWQGEYGYWDNVKLIYE